jgi:hypothetical protein
MQRPVWGKSQPSRLRLINKNKLAAFSKGLKAISTFCAADGSKFTFRRVVPVVFSFGEFAPSK